VKESTRIRVNNEPSLLDLVFTRSKQEVINLGYLPGLGKSDHVILQFEFLLSKAILNKESLGPPRRITKRLTSIIGYKMHFGKLIGERSLGSRLLRNVI